jgi:hypothetical protein
VSAPDPPGTRYGPGGPSVRGDAVEPFLQQAVDDSDAVVASLRARGADLVGEVERYEDSCRLCYVRGPEGIIAELAEQVG